MYINGTVHLQVGSGIYALRHSALDCVHVFVHKSIQICLQNDCVQNWREMCKVQTNFLKSSFNSTTMVLLLSYEHWKAATYDSNYMFIVSFFIVAVLLSFFIWSTTDSTGHRIFNKCTVQIEPINFSSLFGQPSISIYHWIVNGFVSKWPVQLELKLSIKQQQQLKRNSIFPISVSDFLLNSNRIVW